MGLLPQRRMNSSKAYLVMCCVVLIFLLCPLESIAQAVSKPIVFSELSLDNPPGGTNSFLELYNRSEKPISLGGYTIVSDSQDLFRFPDEFEAPPHSIILLRFKGDSAFDNGTNYTVSYRGEDRVVLWGKATSEYEVPEGSKERASGYCMLFSSQEQKKDTLKDLVAWGTNDEYRRILQENGDHIKCHNWALENEIWKGHPVFVGGEAGQLGKLGVKVPEPPAVLQRLTFEQPFYGNGVWAILSKKMASPGAGNPWPVPWATIPMSGVRLPAPKPPMGLPHADFGWGVPVGLSREVIKSKRPFKGPTLRRDGPVPSFQELSAPEEWPTVARLQVAEDPHFENLKFNGMIHNYFRIPEKNLSPGKYYARMRIETEDISTDWSDTVWFFYEK